MGRIPVKLMTDYGVDWPLWAADGLANEDQWPISAALGARLKAWAAHFNDHFDYEHGWDDPARCAQHRSEGETLQALLAQELGTGFEVTVSLWETDDC